MDGVLTTLALTNPASQWNLNPGSETDSIHVRVIFGVIFSVMIILGHHLN